MNIQAIKSKKIFMLKVFILVLNDEYSCNDVSFYVFLLIIGCLIKIGANGEGMQRAGSVADSLSTVTALASELGACKLL